MEWVVRDPATGRERTRFSRTIAEVGDVLRVVANNDARPLITWDLDARLVGDERDGTKVRFKEPQPWPIRVGTKWKVSTEWSHRDGHHGQVLGDSEVTGYEEVVVPAGRFMTFKIEFKGFYSDETGGTGAKRETAWYAPDVKARVRWTADNGNQHELGELLSVHGASTTASSAGRQLPATAGPRQRARALVVGNSKYLSLGTLPNPRNDAQAVAAKFRQFGIDVDLVLDADRAALVKALGDYQDRAAGYDINIFYFAGHGLQLGGVNYIVPVDLPATAAGVGSIKLNAVALGDALEYMPAHTRLVFLDACRDNPLARSLLATRAAGSAGLAPFSASSGTLVAYATRDGSTAEDGNGHNSPFTAALLQNLDAEEDIAVVLRRTRQAVLKATANRQEPWEYGSLVGDALVLSRLGR